MAQREVLAAHSKWVRLEAAEQARAAVHAGGDAVKDGTEAPVHVDDVPTVPVAPQTNRELVYGDRFADDAEFSEQVRWDQEAFR